MKRQQKIINRMKEEMNKKRRVRRTRRTSSSRLKSSPTRTRNSSPKLVLVCYNCGVGYVKIGDKCGFCGKTNKFNKEVN